jgi:hypothetical protein
MDHFRRDEAAGRSGQRRCEQSVDAVASVSVGAAVNESIERQTDMKIPEREPIGTSQGTDPDDLWHLDDADRKAFLESKKQLEESIASRAARNGKAGHSERSGDDDADPVPCVTTLADVEVKPVEWFWKPWVPYRAVTLLDGDPGLGKSTLTLDLAARASRGFSMPPDPGAALGEPVHVLLLSAEDSLAHTIRPRLDAAGADVSRVHSLDAIRQKDDERPPVLPWDLALVKDMIIRRGIRLVVVDPLMAFLGTETDAHKDQDIRRCMHQLKLIAEGTGVAMLVIRHLNKNVGGPALYRGGGSIGIIGAVRSALVVGRHPRDKHRCVLAATKCNLSAMPKSLLYSHEPSGDVSRIGWVGECDLAADDILGHGVKTTVGDRCAAALSDYLADGPKRLKDLEDYITQQGFTQFAVRNDKRLAGVKVKRVGFGPEADHMASLPQEEEEGPAESDDLGDDPFGDAGPC